jgi:DNA-binding beta-propeller fold protein YncE
MDSKKRCLFPYLWGGKPKICQYTQEEGELHCGTHIQACARNPCILHIGKAPTTNKAVSVLFYVPGAAPERLSIQEGKVHSHCCQFKDVKFFVHFEIETSVPSSFSSSSSSSNSSATIPPTAVTPPSKRRRADDAGAYTTVPDDYEIEGKYHAEIKLEAEPMYVACHEGLAYVTHESPTVSVCDVADKKVVRNWPLHEGGWGNGVVVHEQSVYIANGALNCIQVYGLDGTFQRQFGTRGSGDTPLSKSWLAAHHSISQRNVEPVGQLNSPWGLALCGDAYIYVCEQRNHRVQIFTLEGHIINLFGSEGDGPGEFSYPTGLAVDEECVYVCDTLNHRVQVFGLDGTFQRMWGSLGAGVDEFNSPRDVVVQGELLYVSDLLNHRVQVFEKATGTFVRSWGSRGEGPGQLRYPCGLAFSGDDQLYVCDCDNNRIQIFE